MLDKILNAINIFKPIEEVLIKNIVKRGVESFIRFFIAYYAQHEIFKDAGISIDFTKLHGWLLPAAVSGLSAAYYWIASRYNKS